MAGFRTFTILVEGPDDERFIKSIIEPKLIEKGYNHVDIYKYSGLSSEKVNRLLKTLKCLESSGNPYFFLADFDSPRNSCITEVKEGLLSSYSQLEHTAIKVVREEIESWYLAGNTIGKLRKIGVKSKLTTTSNGLLDTEKISKEQFNLMAPKRVTRQEFLIRLLSGDYSMDLAAASNQSFSYFRTSCL